MPSKICTFTTAVVLAGLVIGPALAQQPVAERAGELETRLIDLQVQIGTLRSLKGPVSGPRITALEGELRELAQAYRKLTGKPAGIRPGATSALTPGAAVATNPEQADAPPRQTAQAGGGWSGSTTVTRHDGGPAPFDGGELRRDQVFAAPLETQRNAYPQNPYPQSRNDQNPSQQNPFAQNPDPQGPGFQNPSDRNAPAGNRDPRLSDNGLASLAEPPAARDPVAAQESPKQEYKSAYGALLQQDYAGAETAFTAFIQRHPTSSLAGNAQYWLGETHYVRGDYRQAAQAFLQGAEKYGDGNKGPDSLLKLALSLAKLDQIAPACSSLREVARRYPSAPGGILQRAKSEADRLRCPA